MICIWSSCYHCHPIISCCIKIQISLTFQVPAYQGCPGKGAIKRMSVFHIFVMVGVRDFRFGICVDHSKSQSMDDKTSHERGV